jgi:hypothetical protein
MPIARALELTVVVAAIDAERTQEASIEALVRACRGLSSEILVVSPVNASEVSTGSKEASGIVAYVGAAPKRLAPELWAAGIARARGRIVALTTAQMIVPAGWARALVAALEPPVGAAGGPLEIAPATSPVDWAVFYLRYSAFLASGWTDGPTGGELAGDNAAYLLDDLRRHAQAFDRGFWEIDFHRILRGEGRTLRRVSAARAAFGRSFRLRTFLRQRFEHGREFSRTDVGGGRRSRLRVILRAPGVPIVLALRAARRVGLGSDTRRFVVALPIFVLFATAWAVGEAAGALATSGGGSA